jgi:hypothetical protein
VFQLDAAISAVPGARLQQFTRSPQDEPAAHEQNADFIEIAVPMAALGSPFDTGVKIAAVVAANVLADPATPTRPLDTGFHGTRLTTDGTGSWRIQPLEFQIGPDLDSDDDGLTVPEELALGLDPHHPDRDGDRLPDGWEVHWRLNPSRSGSDDGAEGDPDYDGLGNLAEYYAGTDPKNPASVLRLSATLLPNHQLQLSWLGVVSHRYWLEEGVLDGGSFYPVAGQLDPITGSGATESRRLLLDAETHPQRRFFRVRVEPE